MLINDTSNRVEFLYESSVLKKTRQSRVQLYNVIDQTNEDETRGKPVIYIYIYIYIYERRIWGMLTDLSVLTNIF